MDVTPRETVICVHLKPDRKPTPNSQLWNHGKMKPPLFMGMSFWVKKKSRQGMNNLRSQQKTRVSIQGYYLGERSKRRGSEPSWFGHKWNKLPSQEEKYWEETCQVKYLKIRGLRPFLEGPSFDKLRTQSHTVSKYSSFTCSAILSNNSNRLLCWSIFYIMKMHKIVMYKHRIEPKTFYLSFV